MTDTIQKNAYTSAKTGHSEFANGWKILAVCALGIGLGVSTIPNYSMGTLIVPLQEQFGWTRTQISLALTGSYLTLAFIAPFVGSLIDRFGAKPLILTCIPLFSLCFLATSFVSGSLIAFYIFYISGTLLGAATSPLAYTRIVNGNFRKNSGLALGIALSSAGLMGVILPPALVAAMSAYGWQGSFWLLSIIILIPWLFVYFLIPNEKTPAIKRNDPAPLAKQTASKAHFKSSVFWIIILAFFLISLAVAILSLQLNPLLRDLGVSAQRAAFLTSMIGVGVIVGRLGVGFLIDRFFAPYIAAGLFVATAAGCVALNLGGAPMAFLAAALIGLSLGGEVDLVAFLTVKYFGIERYAAIYGFIFGSLLVGSASGQFLGGFMYDLFGAYTWAVYTAAALLVVGSILLLLLPRYQKGEEVEPVSAQ